MIKFLNFAVLSAIYCILSYICFLYNHTNDDKKLVGKHNKVVYIFKNAESTSTLNTHYIDVLMAVYDRKASLFQTSTWLQPTVNQEIEIFDYENKSVVVRLNDLGKRIGVRKNNQTALSTTLKQFGAKGDGVTDDTQAISKALNSPIPVIYATKTKAYYKVSDQIIIRDINKKKLIATGTKILNSDLKKATFLFQNSKNIEIIGGRFGYSTVPTTNGGNSQHVFQFDGCQSVKVSKIHIINSPEMGIAITNSNKVLIENCIIEHTFRDGTYSHYSANVKYINNIYKNIKDDAMSFHDYGIASEKTRLLAYGYDQATNLIAQGNKVENAYQGFGSIGANKVQVINNKFKNTVLAGIAIFNSKDLYENGTSLAKNSQIVNNIIERSCSTVKINGMPYVNYGQASTGRVAIFVGSLGTNNQLYAGETKRLSNMTVSGNKVSYSGAQGFLCNHTDNLKFVNNSFSNCNGQVAAQGLSGNIIEMDDVNGFWGDNNTVIDNRPKILHQRGYAFNKVSGQMGRWNVKGTIAGEKLLTSTQALRILPKQKQATKLSSKSKATNIKQ